MNENSDLLPNLLHEEFEMQMRGYSRRQVDDFVARRNNEIRELEQRLARTLDESEHLRRELSTVRQQALSGRPAHEEVSERISQILKLADDEAKAQKNKADDDIAKQRSEAQQESERVRADAREQAERMLTAAQEQAERTISAARNEADKTRTAARTEADRLTSDTPQEVGRRHRPRQGAGEEGARRGHGPGDRDPRRRRAQAQPAQHQARGDRAAADRHPGRRAGPGRRGGRAHVA